MSFVVRPGGYYSVGWIARGRDQNMVALVYRLGDHDACTSKWLEPHFDMKMSGAAQA